MNTKTRSSCGEKVKEPARDQNAPQISLSPPRIRRERPHPPPRTFQGDFTAHVFFLVTTRRDREDQPVETGGLANGFLGGNRARQSRRPPAGSKVAGADALLVDDELTASVAMRRR